MVTATACAFIALAPRGGGEWSMLALSRRWIWMDRWCFEPLETVREPGMLMSAGYGAHVTESSDTTRFFCGISANPSAVAPVTCSFAKFCAFDV
jgi:hypothetical protein